MFSVTVLIRSAAVLVAVTAASSSRRADHGACDMGEVAAALTTLPGKLTGGDLWNLCTSRFSQGVCFAAGQTLRAEMAERDVSAISAQQFASSACDAVNVAKHQQQALLQRQEQGTAPAEIELLHQGAPTARAAELAAIRSSPAAHQLSMNVAQHYRDADSAESAGGKKDKLMDLDDVLHRKSFSFPHNTFDWEKNHTTHPSFMMQHQVDKWMEDHALHVDVSRPDIKYRTQFFKKFSANNLNYDVVTAGDQGKLHVDVSLEDEPSKEESSGVKEGVPKQAPAATVQMTALNALKEAQTLRKPMTKNFLASHAEMNSLLSEVMGKNNVKVSH